MADNETISDRIKKYRDSKGFGKREFEQLCGLTNGYLNSVKKPGPDFLESIFRVCSDLNRGWVLSGEGEMLKKDCPNISEEPSINYECKKCKKKDEEINRLNYELNKLKDKYINLLEETQDKKVS